MRRWAPLLIACALACTDGKSHDAPKPAEAAPVDDDLEHLAAEPEPEPPPPLVRGQAPAGTLSEVWLDPEAEAALTLATEGGVTLWPALKAQDPDDSKVWPLTLPLQEPLWLSFAKTRSTHASGSFLIAAIDTSNALQVFEVASVAGKHVPDWEIERRFALAPSDPIFEAHVLAGGERIVALGEDHRVRLYDRDGALLSELSQPNFVPWQLRLGVTDEAGRTGMAAVLTQPLRVQAIALEHDELQLAGEARTLELDRGPNRNDLALSPDGRTVAALRRAHGKGKEWSVELIDLASDERKLIAGKVDNIVRSRMHFVDDQRLLLETGSGQGFWVDLQEAEPLPRREDADPESRFAERMAKRMASEHEVVALPGALEQPEDLPDDDRGWRFRSSTAAGVRAAVDVSGVLIIDPLDQPRHLELGFRSATLTGAALADHWVATVDSHTAFDHDNALIMLDLEADDIVAPSQPDPQVFPILGPLEELAFVAPGKLLAVTGSYDKTPATIHLLTLDAHERKWAQTSIALDLSLERLDEVSAHRAPPGSHVATLGVHDPEHRVLIELDLETQAITQRDFGPDDHAAWPELLTLVENVAETEFPEYDFHRPHARIGSGAILCSNTREVTRRDAIGTPARWTTEVPGPIRSIRLSPDQTTVAILASLPPGFDDGLGNEARLFVDAETGARLWSTKLTWQHQIAWNFGYGDPDVAAWVLVRHVDAFEVVEGRTGERIEFARGLGPAWRIAGDDQAIAVFLSDHVNAEPLTIRP